MKVSGHAVRIALQLSVDTRPDETGIWLEFTAHLMCRCPGSEHHIACREVCCTCAADCSTKRLRDAAHIANRRLDRILSRFEKHGIPVESVQDDFTTLLPSSITHAAS